MDRVPTTSAGVIAVYGSDMEVVAVYPEMSSTILPHGQEIRLYRGDDLDLRVQLQNDGDPPDQVSLDQSVVRWAAKQGYGLVPTSLKNRVILGNEAALIVKRSYDPAEVELSDAARGRAIVHLRRDDTWALPSVSAVWDLEVTKPVSDVTLPEGARVQLVPGSDVALAVNVLWSGLSLRGGDIFEADGRRVLVREVLSDMHLRLDWSSWTGGLTSFQLRRGRTKTAASGAFVLMGDVVR